MSRASLPGSICLDNITGPHALKLNGVYEPTEEMCGSLPVFRKKGNSNQWLECFTSKWRVRLTSSRGTDKCTAWIAIGDRPCLPQDCRAGTWHVDMSTPGYEISPLVTATLLTALPSHLEAVVAQAQYKYDFEVKWLILVCLS